MRIGKLIPPLLYPFFDRVRNFIRSIPYRGNSMFCPVCEKTSNRFASFGIVPREGAKCMQCGALERHRLVWLYFARKTALFTKAPQMVLHVAPEPVFRRLLKSRLGGGYLTADLYNKHVKVKMDITNIQYPDKSFDVIYCSHVLEHVSDDRKALSEFFRVLKPDGWAILLVPITTERTFEDSTVTDPQERTRLFGQEDHLRAYGPDYIERLYDAGFNVKIIKPGDFLSSDEITYMGITRGAGDIYLCTKTGG